MQESMWNIDMPFKGKNSIHPAFQNDNMSTMLPAASYRRPSGAELWGGSWEAGGYVALDRGQFSLGSRTISPARFHASHPLPCLFLLSLDFPLEERPKAWLSYLLPNKTSGLLLRSRSALILWG